MDPFDLVGDVLDDQYRIDEFAGEGVLSVVYRGRHLGVDADVAVKCLNLPPTMDEALAAPVAESFRLGCKLHYRLARGNLHIAQTIASGSTVAPRTGAVVPYLVREWFEGESLAKNFLARREAGEKGRSLEDVLDLFQGAADALRYAHAQQIAHLSLTPSNFFITQAPSPSQPKVGGPAVEPVPQRTIKVLDFGVGRALDVTASDLRRSATPSPGLHLLQPAYAAPEQLSAHVGVPGTASDVYVFALVLLEALADRTVMEGKDVGQIVTRALDRTVRPGPKQLALDLPEPVVAIFDRALAVEPGARYPDVGAFWEELLQADLDVATSSRDPSLPPPAFDEEEPTAQMPLDVLEPLAGSRAARPNAEPSAVWEPSASATARIRGPSLFRRLRHWKTLGLKGKTAAAEAERAEGPISMPPPPPISVRAPPVVEAVQSQPPKISSAPRAPAPAPIPSWHPDPPKAGSEPHIAIPRAPSKPKITGPVTTPPRPAAAPQPLKPLVAPKAAPAKPEPPRAPEAPKPAPKPPMTAAAAPKPPVPAKPSFPMPKRQPTLVMFEHGVDQTAAARTSSPSSPGLPEPQGAATANDTAPPAPSTAPASAPPAAPLPTPAKPEPPPPPADVVSALEGMEAVPVVVPPTAPPSNPATKGALSPSTAPMPMAVPVGAPSPATPPPPAPIPLAPPSDPLGATPPPPFVPPAPPSDPFAATGPPSSRSEPTEQTRGAIASPLAAPSPQNATVFTDLPPARRGPSRAVLAAIVSFVVVLALGVIVIAIVSRSGTKKTVPTATSSTSATSAPTESASATASASASAAASVSASASASAVPSAVASVAPLPTQPKFFKNLAMKALDKAAKDLTDCKNPKGIWGQSAATVTFANDGTVNFVSIAQPYTNRPQGKCVEEKIRTARMAPFLGKSYPVVYFFYVPK